MADAIWFYATGGQQQGPTDLQTLRDMAGYGQLLGSDLVWRNGMADWLPAARVPELAGAFGAPAAAGAAPAYTAPPPSPQSVPYAQPAGIPGYHSSGGQSYASEARTAMILSIIGFFCVGIILGPVGIILGTTARRNMRASGNMEGEGMATAAIVIGWIVVGLSVASILLFCLLSSASSTM